MIISMENTIGGGQRCKHLKPPYIQKQENRCLMFNVIKFYTLCYKSVLTARFCNMSAVGNVLVLKYVPQLFIIEVIIQWNILQSAHKHFVYNNILLFLEAASISNTWIS